MVANRGAVIVLALSKEPMPIPTMELVHREIKVAGSFQGSRKDVKDMLAFVEQYKIQPWLVKVQFDQINEAIELMKKGTARYSIVLEAGSQEPVIPASAKKAGAEQTEAARAQVKTTSIA
ncbi:hypothetical protein BGZ65_010781 [Modicella reniformis]|uniref:Alcohol dehydrogenase n=1 Tax=Modicella reniformis TaxID=1440133 RepID=A0A9P6LVM3_9FUNG|nr:hypothetical protein BGZ65_010781 [Modicella reniformis]